MFFIYLESQIIDLAQTTIIIKCKYNHQAIRAVITRSNLAVSGSVTKRRISLSLSLALSRATFVLKYGSEAE